MSRRTRRSFTAEFKREVVQLSCEGGVSVNQLAKDFDLNPNIIYRWRREMQEDGTDAFRGKGKLKAEEAQLRELERENRRLKQEIEILKKAAAYFSKEHLL